MVKLEPNIYLLSSSKLNFGSKFNVIICNFFPITIFELARNSSSARYSLHMKLNWIRISIFYLARNSISGRKSMSLFVTFSNFDLRAGSKFKFSSIFASHRVQFEPKMYLLSSSKFNFGSKFDVIICNFSNFDLRAGSKFKLSSIFASHKVKLDPNIYFLSSSKFNFGLKFNVIIYKFFPISIFELAQNSNSGQYSFQIGLN